MTDSETGHPEPRDESRVTGNDKVAWWHWHRRLYDWVVHFADTKHGERALFLLSFAESSFFPVPPDVLLAPLALGAPKKWFRFAFACSIASVLGGIFGYIIGIALWTAVGNFFHDYVPGFGRDTVVLKNEKQLTGMFDPGKIYVELPLMKTTVDYPIDFRQVDGTNHVLTESQIQQVTINPFTKVGAAYYKYDWIIVAIAGFTPIPFKVITITAGVFRINFFIFCITAAMSRSARFFMVSGLMGWKGEKIKPVIEKYFNWFSLAFVVLLVGGFLVFKWLH
jgi:membrane protein YqaA with SNARE-associated domain